MDRKKTLSKMLSQYEPRPGKSFYQRMATSPWNAQRRSFAITSFGWKFAVGFVMIFVILGVSIPPVRATLSGWLGLSIAPSNKMPVTAVTIVPITPPAPKATQPAVSLTPTGVLPTQTNAPTLTSLPVTPSPAGPTPPAEISQASSQAGWNILYPIILPEGYQLQSAYYDTNNQMVMVSYRVTRPLPDSTDTSLTVTKMITLLEAQRNDFVPMQIAPASNIEDVSVNGQPAVFTMGAWDTSFVKDDNDPNGGKMVSTWRNDLPVQNLYWQVGNVYLVLVTADEVIGKQELIDMAASISAR